MIRATAPEFPLTRVRTGIRQSFLNAISWITTGLASGTRHERESRRLFYGLFQNCDKHERGAWSGKTRSALRAKTKRDLRPHSLKTL